MSRESHEPIINDKEAAVPFTARLIAHYRVLESKRNDPLIVDPYAERLVGDLSSYFEMHKRTAGQVDYAIVRSYYIENNLLIPWCNKNTNSQIVILGAGLDTRVYRLKSLQSGTHTIFEIDFPNVNKYKEKILQNETPLCKLQRVSIDLSDSDWIIQLKEARFSSDIPTFWILEGLVYYLEKEVATSIIRKASEVSMEASEIFVDVCIPIFAELKYGPFTMHFKWGLDKKDMPSFFANHGWKVTCAFADDYDQGRDVGQKGLIFVHGMRDISNITNIPSMSIQDSSGPELLKGVELQNFAQAQTEKIIPEIEEIIDIYETYPEQGLAAYLDFMKDIKPSLERIAKGMRDALSLGNISPRLLSDPLSIEKDNRNRSLEEKEAYVVGFLKAVLQLLYCAAKGLEGEQFIGTPLHKESIRTQAAGKINIISRLVQIMKQEIVRT